jgi:RNA polymerase sigma factor for flagellar operon FliA
VSVYLVKWPVIMNNPRPSSRVTDGQRSTSAAALVNYEAFFLANLPVIDAVIRAVCRRYHLTADESSEFASDVRFHIIGKDYELLRKFEGRSRLDTYLTVAIVRLFLDRRNRLWGKWRPSAEAKRLGKLAILLERLVTRDGLTFEQVVETLRTNHGVEMNDQLYALYVKLAQRAPSRQFVIEDEAEKVPTTTPGTDGVVLRAEQDFLTKRMQTAVDRVRETLTPEDQLILKMRFEDSVSVADIARALHVNQKRLYVTIGQLLDMLRRGFEAEGISRDDAKALIEHAALDRSPIFNLFRRAGAAGLRKSTKRARAPWPNQ